jgi:hypothetical protein
VNAPITVTATVSVWLNNSEYSRSRPQDLVAALERGDPLAVVNAVAFYGPADKEKFSDCIKVGVADITMRLISRDEQTRMALEGLNEQLQKLRAAYQERQQEILTQISKLQAITFEVPA